MSIISSIPFLKKYQFKTRQLISDSWSDRDQILEEDVNLFCWNRLLDPEITKYLNEIVEEKPKPLAFPVSQVNCVEEIQKAQEKWSMFSSQSGQSFWDDVTSLVGDFLKYSRDGSGTTHIRVISNDACAKFHTDGYELRLFTTYIGDGTVWLPEAAVNRSALGTENDQIVKDPSMIKQMNTGAVGILKGELPNRAQKVKGIVHKSPEIGQTGKKRIILRIDI